MRFQPERSSFAPLRSVKHSLVASEKFATYRTESTNFGVSSQIATLTLFDCHCRYLHLLVLSRPLPLVRQGVLRFALIPAQFFSARPSHPRTGWHGVLAQRTPPMRAAAKRRRGPGQAQSREGHERQSLRRPSGCLTAQSLRTDFLSHSDRCDARLARIPKRTA